MRLMRMFAVGMGLLLGQGVLVAGTVRVADAEAARLAVRAAKPGDIIELAAGEWRDADLRLDGEGSAEAPITVRAERLGETILSGASRVRLGGRYLVVRGLHLRNLSGSKADWLEFRIDSKRRASHCRFTECALTEDADFEPKEKESRWVGLYGEENELDHCWIEGKKNRGTSVVVWLGEQDGGRHRLHHNFFGHRPRLGKNGGEILRVGDSASSLQEAKCLVENNFFYRCNGETECVSNKSCGNVYRANRFVEVEGTLTLRHGNGCVVEKNEFWGQSVKQTGGIRVIGEDHQILENHLQDLEGDGFRSAITLVNGVPDSPLNGYWQVKNTVIRGNTILNCKQALLLGYNDVKEASLEPVGTRLEGNRLELRSGQPVPELPTGLSLEQVEARQVPSMSSGEWGPSWRR
jgi:poly(beta-D-mannuronate) lyase